RLTGELIEGMSFAESAAFDTWLAVERRHLAATAQALLLERAQAELGAGHAEAATRLATRLVELNPLEEAHHELLVRSLLAQGDTKAALGRAEACEALLRREVGAAPSARLRALVRAAEAPPAAAVITGTAAARGQLEAG